MSATERAIYIEQGSDWSESFTLIGDDGQPVNLTNLTGEMEIREVAYSTDILATVTVVFPDPENGKVIRSLTAAQTAAIPVKGANFKIVSNYTYDFYLVNALGQRTRVFNGPAQISPGVTR